MVVATYIQMLNPISAMPVDLETVLSNHAKDGYPESWDSRIVDKRMPDGDAVIHWVARYGTDQEMTTLLNAGATIDLRGDLGRTPLMEAVAFGNVAVLELLLGRGASIELKDDYGESIYDLVLEENHSQISRILGNEV